jgi:hypothetical protein
MVKTQIQLPDSLYRRVKQFSREREIPLAEVARRGMELLLDRYPEVTAREKWELPRVDGGSLKLPLEELKDVAYRDEERGDDR